MSENKEKSRTDPLSRLCRAERHAKTVEALSSWMSRAIRLEQHLARLTDGWKRYSAAEDATGEDIVPGTYTSWLDWFNNEYAAAEEALKELGVKHD